MGEGKRGKPGSELERLQIFAELATEYLRMVELFTPDGRQVAADSVEAERRHWVELFRGPAAQIHRSRRTRFAQTRGAGAAPVQLLGGPPASRGRSGSGRDVHQRDDPGP